MSPRRASTTQFQLNAGSLAAASAQNGSGGGLNRRTSYSAVPITPPQSPLRQSHSIHDAPLSPPFEYPRRSWLPEGIRRRPTLWILATLNVVSIVLYLFVPRHALPSIPTQASLDTLRPYIEALNFPTSLTFPSFNANVPDLATQSCELCIIDPSHPLCEYGIDNIRLSRMYEGSGYRVRKFLEKALRGEKVKIGVMGASVTTGHGVPPDRPIWQDRFFEDFVTIFPNAELIAEPVPGVTSWYYGMCFNSMFPDDIDLYLIELDINNEAIDRTYKEDDTLFRGLLGLPNEPAVIRVSVFALMFGDLARGTVSSLLQSNFFDVPVVGIRNFLMPQAFLDPNSTETFFSHADDGEPDLRHISWQSHQALGDMLSLYLRSQVCETKRRIDYPPLPRDNIWPTEAILGKQPTQHVWEKFKPGNKIPTIHPSCQLTSSKLSPLVPIVSRTTGNWEMVEWNNKRALNSHTVGDLISFGFTGTQVGLFVWNTNGKKNPIKPGKSLCWVDDQRQDGTVVDAWHASDVSGTGFIPVVEGLREGHHILTCEIMAESSTEGHDFRIIGVGSQ
ncbi:capsular related protein, Esterase, SGNH hydrolase-type domain containing [Pseudohyphozyma bogoriensis]|nr:capsular related protein, Esterase, SGNH hydrolase-type domain containing [Pseudohyphozyma bogoriensis]